MQLLYFIPHSWKTYQFFCINVQKEAHCDSMLSQVLDILFQENEFKSYRHRSKEQVTKIACFGETGSSFLHHYEVQFLHDFIRVTMDK